MILPGFNNGNEIVGKVPKTKHSKLLLKLNQHASTYRFYTVIFKTLKTGLFRQSRNNSFQL